MVGKTENSSMVGKTEKSNMVGKTENSSMVGKTENSNMVGKTEKKTQYFHKMYGRACLSDDSRFLGCDAVSLGEYFQTFRVVIVPTSSRSSGPRRTAAWRERVCCIIWLWMVVWGRTEWAIRSIGRYSPDDTPSHLRRLQPSTSNLNSCLSTNFPEICERFIFPLFFFVALRPNAGHDLLILDVSRSHTTTLHSQ